MSFFSRRSPIDAIVSMMRFVNKGKATTGRNKNTHISKRAMAGLYHGKDVQFGNSISHSKAKTLKKWLPNVINKRVWSETLDDWVRFKMTTTALKEIDKIGGIDNYILNLDNKSVSLSNYITKMRTIIGTSLYHQGLLNEMFTRKLGYHRFPPEPLAPISIDGAEEEVHFA